MVIGQNIIQFGSRDPRSYFLKGAASMGVPPHAHFVLHLNDLDLGLDIHGRTEYFNGWGTIFYL